ADAVEEFSREGATALVVMASGIPVGVLAVADTIRESSAQALRELRDEGVTNLEMLTGDNRYTAEAIASQAAVTKVSAELMPQDKVTRVSELMRGGAVTAMGGAGINDAPALATASLGVTMGAAASDTALEVADVAMLSDDMRKLPAFIRLSKRTMNVVKENVGIAIGVKVLVMILVIAGLAGMGAAVFADTGVAVIVILNGMRLMTDWETRF
ncbi:MAG: HAD-IC family P-type ATPase, partial [Atopobiaceae bacterium]|nr:HAD-IC family P-type ATPase [Atopobiaceae bacterium]